MNGLYRITTMLKDQLLLDEFVTTVNTGEIDDIMLKKQDVYPYSHIMVNNATYYGSTWMFNISIMCMDIVDISKEDTAEFFYGNDNYQDVWNTQLAVINRTLEVLRRGENVKSYVISGTPNCEPFKDRFEHNIAGWTCTFDIEMPNTMTVCDNDVTPVKICPDFNYTITDLDSNVLYTGSLLSGQDLIQIIQGATVTNSDASYTATILAEGSLVLPDVTNTDSDGTPVVTPAQTPFVCTPVAPCADATATLDGSALGTIPSGTTTDFHLVDQDDITIVPDSIISGTIKVTVGGGGTLQGSMPMRTGRTTGIYANDDGFLQMGRETDFTTLSYLNPFGNNKRFTDKTDAGIFTNGVVYDWSTWNETNGTVLAYYHTDTAFDTLANQLSRHITSTIDGLVNNWNLCNVNQLFNIVNWDLNLGFMLNYAPFNSGSRYFWMSTTVTDGNGFRTDLAGYNPIIAAGVGNTYLGIWCRECTVVGTTIT